MTQPEDIIDRIVAGVLEQLRPPGAERLAPSASDVTAGVKTIEIADEVITAGLLEERAAGARQIVIGAKSVLTPSARELLAQRKIDWSRAKPGQAPAAEAVTWLALVARSTPAVAAALDALAKERLTDWKREVIGCHREAAARAVGALCRAEFDGVVVFTARPEAVACAANRNSKIRAATFVTVARARAAREQLGVNLAAVDPTDRSINELRTLLRTITSGGKPAAPPGWSE